MFTGISMKTPNGRRRTGLLLLIAAGLGVGATTLWASGTYVPSVSIPNRETQELKRGENMFTDRRLGRFRRSCESCHAGEEPFNRKRPDLTKENIPKLILYCLTTRVGNTKMLPGDRKFRALQLYTTKTYKLDEPIEPENPEGLTLIEEAKENYGNGEFELAQEQLMEALEKLNYPSNKAEAHFLHGMVHFILAETTKAKESWTRAAEADSDYEPNPDLFSPKALAVFYQVRGKVRSNQ